MTEKQPDRVYQLLLVGIMILFAGCNGMALPSPGVQDGEKYNATFEIEGDCPTGTTMMISPTHERNATARFWRVEAGDYEFEVTGNQTYDLKLVRPGMKNQTIEWTATSKRVVFKNEGSGDCSFDV